jgi:hypothetical protein
MDPLVIRIRFRSGAVSEERGTEAHCVALLDQDENQLIDYVQWLDPITGEFALFVHDDDPNWDDATLDVLFGS